MERPAREEWQVIIADRLTEREHEIARLGITPGTLTGPLSDDDGLDWRRVGEPESWMGLRSERAMAYRPNSAVPGGSSVPVALDSIQSNPRRMTTEAAEDAYYKRFVPGIVSLVPNWLGLFASAAVGLCLVTGFLLG
jgi:hypothetical protein